MMNAAAPPPHKLTLFITYTSTKDDGKNDVMLALPTWKEELDLYERRAREEKENHFVVLETLVLDLSLGMD